MLLLERLRDTAQPPGSRPRAAQGLRTHLLSAEVGSAEISAPQICPPSSSSSSLSSCVPPVAVDAPALAIFSALRLLRQRLRQQTEEKKRIQRRGNAQRKAETERALRRGNPAKGRDRAALHRGNAAKGGDRARGRHSHGRRRSRMYCSRQLSGGWDLPSRPISVFRLGTSPFPHEFSPMPRALLLPPRLFPCTAPYTLLPPLPLPTWRRAYMHEEHLLQWEWRRDHAPRHHHLV